MKILYHSIAALLVMFLQHSILAEGIVDDAEKVIDAITSTFYLNSIARRDDIPENFAESMIGLGKNARPCDSSTTQASGASQKSWSSWASQKSWSSWASEKSWSSWASDTLLNFWTSQTSWRDGKYARVDAVCNNLRQPFLGSVLAPERRLFANTYLDGRGFPRTRDEIFHRLPSAREVSRRCLGREEDGEGPGHRIASQMVWQYGQLIVHDISLVELVPGLDNCCDAHVLGVDHPDLHRDGPCFPIDIEPDDPAFNTTCMPFTRSFAVDIDGVRQQINGVTSFIDGSFIYGSDKKHEHDLRLSSQGLMRTREDFFLPRWGITFPCKTDISTTSGCPAAGDSRVNIQPGLGALHTMFLQEHNRIATLLFRFNRLWPDEIIYQTARKIMIAIVQKITYEEFLPVVLGDDVMGVFNLTGDYYYDPLVDPSAQLEFSTAAFRFGHTLINTHVGDRLLHEQFFTPIVERNHVQAILFNMSKNAALLSDNRFSNSIRELLFFNVSIPGLAPPGVTFDLLARNIQRGRDHGIATYTTARDFCRRYLRNLTGINQDPPACLAEGVYKHEEDIDLFVGGISERPLDDAVVGPTFGCLIASQFRSLRFGDRFFYETQGPERFTPAQLKFIRRTTMASLICELRPEETLQRDVFRVVSDSNPLVPCQTIIDERRLEDGVNLFSDNEFPDRAGNSVDAGTAVDTIAAVW